MKRKNHIIIIQFKLFFSILLVISMFICTTAAAPLDGDVVRSYYYNKSGKSVPSPSGYELDASVGKNLGEFGSLSSPSDLYVKNQEVFVLDNGNNRIVVFNKDLIPEKSIYVNYNAGLEDAKGLFVDEDGMIYIALLKQKLILVCSQDGIIENEIKQPVSSLIPNDFLYAPSKVLVNSNGYICVVSEGSYYGIILLNKDGDFEGFYASDKVQQSVITVFSNFIRRFFTKAQKSKLRKALPTEYSSIAIDDDGFLYTTSANNKDRTKLIKKLSPAGTDILLNSNKMPYGDMESTIISGAMVQTQFMDVCVDNKGFINALDAQRGKIFQYDQESNLISIFGSMGEQVGTFSEPVAVDCIDSRVLVLDNKRSQFMSFTPTEYGNSLRKAIVLYNDGKFTKSKAIWKDVLDKNSGLELAYDGLGKAAMAEDDNVSAMKYFKLSQNRDEYSKAFEANRSNLVQKWFLIIFCLVISLLAVIWWSINRKIKSQLSPRQIARQKRFVSPWYCIFHPADGFEQLKLEKKGSYLYSILILLLVLITKMLSLQATGFMFNTRSATEINLPFEIAQVFVLFAAWVLCNWSVSTLMDGEGFAGEIIIMSAYSLTPYIISGLTGIILSNILTLNEAIFVNGIVQIGLVWCAICMICGIMKVHKYSFSKTLVSIVLTIIGMLFLLFIIFLLFSLVGQLSEFIQNIWAEIRFRT